METTNTKPTTEIEESIEDSRRLEFTQRLRENLIKKVVVDINSPNVPSNEDGVKLLTSLLDGMDRTTLSKMKSKAEDNLANNSAQTSAQVAQLLSLIIPEDIKVRGITREAPTLDKSIQIENAVPGETEISTKQTNYDDFMNTL